LYLIWIANDLRKDLVEMKNKIKSPVKKSTEPSYIQSVYKVLFADITISFDNVIGVVGASKGYFGFMIFGLVLSVVFDWCSCHLFSKLYSKASLDCLCCIATIKIKANPT
jgi:predicted tellurium resistance membrane protein TerC